MKHITSAIVATLLVCVNFSATAQDSEDPQNPSIWINVAGVPSGLLYLPAVTLVSTNEAGKFVTSCLEGVKLMLKTDGVAGVEFTLSSIGIEAVGQGKCILPFTPK